MSVAPEDLAKRALRAQWHHLSDNERQRIASILARSAVARDASQLADAERSFGERLADRFASFGGSWTFIVLFLSFLGAWVVLNTSILGPRGEAFDPYPYIFLNLFLSMLAALQAPIIMMSQNRQAARDRVDAQNDYDVNLNAELQIRAVHDKPDELSAGRWEELIALQREQLELLRALASRTSAS
jgi:uncharacterized membrane protein